MKVLKIIGKVLLTILALPCILLMGVGIGFVNFADLLCECIGD